MSKLLCGIFQEAKRVELCSQSRQTLQLAVLLLKFLQQLRLGNLQTTVFLAPPIVALFVTPASLQASAIDFPFATATSI